MLGVVLEGYKYILVLAVLGEVDAHALESVGGEQGYERGVLFFQLVCDVFEGFAHGVLDHLLFGLLHLLEALV